MTHHITTVILVHVARRWRTFHRRHMLLALGDALPDDTALVCVDRPITPDVTLWKYPARFWTGIWRVREEKDGNRLRVVTLRLAAHDITTDRIPALQPVNRWLARRQLRSYLRARFPEARRVIQWIYHPVQGWLFDVLPKAGRVYECYDEYARTAEGEWVASRWRKEGSVLERAALTFVTTENLMQTRRAEARRMALLPNGVPSFFFDRVDCRPDPVDCIPHPRLGYVGNVRPPIDLELLEALSRRRPDWNIVFVGPVARSRAVGRLRCLRNVHFLGVRPFQQLPGIIRRLDIGLIPFRINDFSVVLKPLKLGEYLACGLPVVSSELPELQSMRDLIWSAPNRPDAFEQAVGRALEVDRSAYADRATAAARDLSWPAIVRRHVLPELKQTFGI